jgi:hypothetical protein
MWYFIEDNQRRGSFSLEEMESLASQGDINENTLVWKKGMKDWQPLVQTQLKDILPEDVPPPVPSELPPPFPTSYEQVKEERSETTSPSPQPTTSQDDIRIKLLYAAKARIWAHWLFWIFIPYIGGIISVTKAKSWEGVEPRLQAIWLLMFPIMATILPNFLDDSFRWWVGLLSCIFNSLGGAYKTQELIEKARSQLNIKHPLQAERQLLKHFQ